MATTTNGKHLLGYALSHDEVNPWAFVQHRLLLEMYPPFKPGYPARSFGLVALLACVILVACALLWTTVEASRRKHTDMWLFRLIRRPAGHYLVLNQYSAYPIFALILAVAWIVRTLLLWRMFGGAHASPHPLFLLWNLMWLPLLLHLSTTTFAVLSGANLASQGRQPNSHRLSPFVANGIFFVLVIVVSFVVLGTGLWSGLKWQRFSEVWSLAYEKLGEAAASYDGVVDESLIPGLQALLTDRVAQYNKFETAQSAVTVVFCVTAGCLILINIAGGLYLLTTLRALGNRQVVPRNTPLVAPLQPFTTTLGSTTFGDATRAPGVETNPWEVDTQENILKLKSLEWDVTLFFLSVVPSCILFIAFSAWISTSMLKILTNAALYEFCLDGPIWIYSCITFCSMLALTINTLLKLHRRRSTSHSTPLAGTDGELTAAENLKRREMKTRELELDFGSDSDAEEAAREEKYDV